MATSSSTASLSLALHSHDVVTIRRLVLPPNDASADLALALADSSIASSAADLIVDLALPARAIASIAPHLIVALARDYDTFFRALAIIAVTNRAEIVDIVEICGLRNGDIAVRRRTIDAVVDLHVGDLVRSRSILIKLQRLGDDDPDEDVRVAARDALGAVRDHVQRKRVFGFAPDPIWGRLRATSSRVEAVCELEAVLEAASMGAIAVEGIATVLVFDLAVDPDQAVSVPALRMIQTLIRVAQPGSPLVRLLAVPRLLHLSTPARDLHADIIISLIALSPILVLSALLSTLVITTTPSDTVSRFIIYLILYSPPSSLPTAILRSIGDLLLLFKDTPIVLEVLVVLAGSYRSSLPSPLPPVVVNRLASGAFPNFDEDSALHIPFLRRSSSSLRRIQSATPQHIASKLASLKAKGRRAVSAQLNRSSNSGCHFTDVADIIPFEDGTDLDAQHRRVITDLQSSSWQVQTMALGLLRRLAIHHAGVVVVEGVLLMRLVASLSSLRSSLVRHALITTRDLLVHCPITRASLSSLTPELLRRAGDANDFLALEAQGALEALVTRRMALPALLMVRARSQGEKLHLGRSLARCVASRGSSLPMQARTLKLAGELLEEGAAEVRLAGRALVEALAARSPSLSRVMEAAELGVRQSNAIRGILLRGGR